MATRGARPEHNDDGIHYPGTYLAGIYNRTTSTIHGRDLEEEHLVNVPNWLPLDLAFGTGPWWSSGGIQVSEERTEVDLRAGISTRRATLTGPDGKQLTVVQRRLTAMDKAHLAAMETTLSARGFNGPLRLRAGIDGAVANTNVRDYNGTGQVHLTAPAFTGTDAETILCETETTQSRIRIALALRTVITADAAVTPGTVLTSDRRYQRQFELRLIDGQSVTITSTAAVATSRDAAISSPRTAVLGDC